MAFLTNTKCNLLRSGNVHAAAQASVGMSAASVFLCSFGVGMLVGFGILVWVLLFML